MPGLDIQGRTYSGRLLVLCKLPVTVVDKDDYIGPLGLDPRDALPYLPMVQVSRIGVQGRWLRDQG
jgi:hypothetical protein